MPLSVATQKLINEAVADRKPVLVIGGTESERLALAHEVHHALPPLTKPEESDLTRIYEQAGIEPISGRPFRAPHHTISEEGLCGSKAMPMPGEAALAHAGVLFLDSVTQFKPRALKRLLKLLSADADSTIKPFLIAGAESDENSLDLGPAMKLRL